MKRIFLFVLLAISLQVSAQGKKEKIIQLFELMQSDKMINSTFENMSKTILRHNVNKADPKKDSVYKAFVEEESKAFARKLLHEDMVELYDKYFTAEDIQAFINFYQSPAGKKMVSLTPDIQKDLFINISKKHMPEMQEKFKKKIEEIFN